MPLKRYDLIVIGTGSAASPAAETWPLDRTSKRNLLVPPAVRRPKGLGAGETASDTFGVAEGKFHAMTDQEHRHITDLLAAHEALIHWCETLSTAHADLVELASDADLLNLVDTDEHEQRLTETRV